MCLNRYEIMENLKILLNLLCVLNTFIHQQQQQKQENTVEHVPKRTRPDRLMLILYSSITGELYSLLVSFPIPAIFSHVLSTFSFC